MVAAAAAAETAAAATRDVRRGTTPLRRGGGPGVIKSATGLSAPLFTTCGDASSGCSQRRRRHGKSRIVVLVARPMAATPFYCARVSCDPLTT